MNRKQPASPASPKLFRSIREVSGVLGVKPHVLRYWETQFPTLRPRKNRVGNRMYRPEEIVLLERIKELLYAQRFTIEGARRLLSEEKKPRVSVRAGAVTSKASAGADSDPSRVAELAGVAANAAREAEQERARLARALRAAESSLTAVARRDHARAAALAALGQDLAAVARELRGEEEAPERNGAEAPAESEPAVVESIAMENPAPAIADGRPQRVAPAGGGLPIPVGA